VPQQQPIACLIANAADRGRVRRFLNAELDAQVKARGAAANDPYLYRLIEERIDALMAMYPPLLGDARYPKIPPV
jgi:hypothetical protein